MWIDFNKDILKELGSGILADFIPIFRRFPDKRTRRVIQISEDMIGEFEHEMKTHRESYDPGKVN